MKITAIETLVCHARMRNWVFVKVVTDQPGLIGWGEATLEWHTRSIVGAIEDMSHLLIGEDPTRVEYQLAAVRTRAAAMGMTMKIVEVEPVLGGEFVAVHYLSEERVDFRELVPQLARHFRAH
ncbi:MAG: PSP1 C-terminal domain-containing protein, partial [Prosthecobacter sp.]